MVAGPLPGEVAVVIVYVAAGMLFLIGVGMACAGKPRATLAERVDALRPVPLRPPPPAPLFDSPVFVRLGLSGPMEALRPRIEAMGSRIARVLHLDTETLSRQLALAGRTESLPLYIGNKVIGALLALVLVPTASVLKLIPGLRVWGALLLAAAAWFGPDLAIKEQGRARKVTLEQGLAVACLDIALRVAGGAGPTEAVNEAAQAGGPFAQELTTALALASSVHASPADALEDLSTRTGLEGARDLATALRAAEQGAPLAETLLQQAKAIGERHSQDSRAAGQRAEVLMVVVQAALLFPGIVLLLLYPMTTTLLRLGQG
jgi:Flp pilus assembly protein TadB